MSDDSSSSCESSESSFEEDFPQQMFTSFDGEELQIQPYLFEPELQIETSEDSEDSAKKSKKTKLMLVVFKARAGMFMFVSVFLVESSKNTKLINLYLRRATCSCVNPFL